MEQTIAKLGLFNDDEDILSTKEALNLQNIQLNDDLHSICLDVLIRHLFSKYLEAEAVDGSVIEEKQRKIVEVEWTNKLKLMYPDLKCLGYVGFILQETVFRSSKILIPKLVDRRDYDLVRLRDKNYQETIFARWTGDGIHAPASELFVFIDSSHHPNFTTKTHNSTISSTVGHSMMMSDMMNCFMLSLKQLSYPVMVVNRTIQSTNIDATIEQLERGEPVLADANRAREKFDAAEAASSSDIADGRFISGNRGQSYFTDAHSANFERKTFFPTIVDNKYCMAPNWEVSKTQPILPILQPNILEFKDKLETHITAKYGIPISIINSGARTGTRASGNAIDDNDMILFSHTIENESTLVCKLAEFVYLCSRPELNGESDLVFRLPTRPFMSTSKIIQLSDYDIISHDTMKEYAAAVSNIPKKDILQGKNKHDRPPLNGNENQTDLMMSKKAKAMDGDSAKSHAEAQRILAERDNVLQDIELKKAQIGKLNAEAKAIKEGKTESKS